MTKQRMCGCVLLRNVYRHGGCEEVCGLWRSRGVGFGWKKKKKKNGCFYLCKKKEKILKNKKKKKVSRFDIEEVRESKINFNF